MVLSDCTHFQDHVTFYTGYRVDNRLIALKKGLQSEICSRSRRKTCTGHRATYLLLVTGCGSLIMT